MLLQFDAEQRCHTPLVVGDPDHVPYEEVSFDPTATELPGDFGAAVLTGAGATGWATTALDADVATALDPAEFVARTCRRTWWPTSADVTTYVSAVAPVMPAQAPALQRCHCARNDIGSVPVQVP